MPPVAPRPRPEIIGTCRSQQANSGASGSETLSPMPPVECLSTFGDSPAGHSNVTPEWSMCSVSAAVSATVMPRRYTAIAQAAIW